MSRYERSDYLTDQIMENCDKKKKKDIARNNQCDRVGELASYLQKKKHFLIRKSKSLLQ